MSEIIVRPSRESDGPALGLVSYRSHTISFGKFTSERFVAEQDLDEHTTWWKGFLVPTESGSRTLVAELDGELVGFCMFGPLTDWYTFYEATRQLNDVARTAVIYSLHVDPDHLGVGAGQRLMESCLDDLRSDGTRTVVLDTYEANSRARRFYEAGRWNAVSAEHSDAEGPIVIYSRSPA